MTLGRLSGHLDQEQPGAGVKEQLVLCAAASYHFKPPYSALLPSFTAKIARSFGKKPLATVSQALAHLFAVF